MDFLYCKPDSVKRFPRWSRQINNGFCGCYSVVRESGIRNPTFFCYWNPESSALESGIQSLESGIQPVESGFQPHPLLWNLGLECTTLLAVITQQITTYPLPRGVPYHHHHQKCLMLAGFWCLTGHKFKIIFLSVVFLNFSVHNCFLSCGVSHRAICSGIQRLRFYSVVLMIC